MIAMPADFFAALWGIIVDTAPYMLVGVLLSGLLHQSIARWNWLQKIIRGRNPVSLLFCNLLGLSMPLCSCGVVPMAVGLRRGHNIPLGNTFAFLFSAPVTSLTALVLFFAVFGLTFTAFYLLGGLVCGFVIGLVFYLVERKPEWAGLAPAASCGPLVEPPLTGGFLQRSLKWGLGIYGSRIAFDQIIGLSLCALALVLVPLTDISVWLNQAPYLLAALLLVLVALPLFVCSIPAILLAGAMVLSGLKPELAWVFLMAGPITNLGDINVMRRQFGRIPVAIYMAAVLLVVTLWGLVIKSYVHLNMIFDNVYAYFDSTVAQIDLCVTDFVQQGQGLWELLAANWWPMISIFSAPFYVALIANGAYHAWNEYYRNPCMYCAHYQKEVQARLGRCDTPCWKLKLQERLVRFSAAYRLPAPSLEVRETIGSLRKLIPPALLLGLLLAGFNLYQLSNPTRGQADGDSAGQLQLVVDTKHGTQYKPHPDIKPTVLPGIMGYTQRFSLTQGEDVKVFIAGNPKYAERSISRIEVFDAVKNTLVYQLAFKAGRLGVPVAKCQSYMGDGCAFPASIIIPGRFLEPGVYRVAIHTTPRSRRRRVYDVYFNIRPKVVRPGQMVVLLPTFTWHAYNNIGGASFYSKHPFNIEPRVVSLLRPMTTRSWTHFHNTKGYIPILKHLSQQGYDYVTIDDYDLHTNGQLLSNAGVVLLLVHEEYVTWEMRQAMQQYVESGGKMLVAGGNTSYRKLLVAGDNLILYREKPPKAKGPEFFSGTWGAKETLPPEATFGLGYKYHEFPLRRRYQSFEDLPPNTGLTRKQYQDSAGMIALAPDHPIFASTGLKRGEVFGASIGLNAIESDGLPMDSKGMPDYSRAPKAVPGIIPLAYSHGSALKYNPVITMVEVPLGKGVILNLGTMGWYRVFQKQDEQAKQIFDNSIEYLLSR